MKFPRTGLFFILNMTRQTHLQQTAYRIVRYLSLGKPSNRRVYYNTLKHIIRDGAHLHHLPAEWSALTSVHVEAWVAYWHKQGVKINRISDRLSTLRHFCKHLPQAIEVPSNRELGIVKHSCVPEYKMIAPHIMLPKIELLVVRNIVALQCYCGLTKSEAIILSPMVAQRLPDTLLITRDLAHNSKDRVIPMVSKRQQACLAQRTHLLNGKINLLTIMSLRDWMALYKGSLQLAGFCYQTSYRRHYVQQRYTALKPFPTTVLSIIAAEIGMGEAWVRRFCHE